MELVTGRAGSPHITSQQDRQKHQGIWGTGAYILNTGNNLEAVVQSSNNIQIKDGALMSQGALFSVKVGTVDEVTIANGSQGMKRKDVIVARYTYNQGANTENAEWAVVQGTPVASNPQIPQITEGDIQAGDATVDTAVFIVTLDGINITAVDVVPEVAPDLEEIKAQLKELNGKISAALTPVKVWEGGLLEAGQTYNFQDAISKSGIILAKVGLTQYERYVTWSAFPGIAIGDQVTWTDYYSNTAFYQVKAALSETSITINEINRGQNWANSHIYMQIFKIG